MIEEKLEALRSMSNEFNVDLDRNLKKYNITEIDKVKLIANRHNFIMLSTAIILASDGSK